MHRNNRPGRSEQIKSIKYSMKYQVGTAPRDIFWDEWVLALYFDVKGLEGLVGGGAGWI